MYVTDVVPCKNRSYKTQLKVSARNRVESYKRHHCILMYVLKRDRRKLIDLLISIRVVEYLNFELLDPSLPLYVIDTGTIRVRIQGLIGTSSMSTRI